MDSGDVYFTLKDTNTAETGLFYFSMEDSAYLPFEDEAIMLRTLKEEEEEKEREGKPVNLIPAELTEADLYDINDPLQRELYGRDESQGPHRPPVPVLGPNIFETLTLSLDPTDEELYGPSVPSPPGSRVHAIKLEHVSVGDALVAGAELAGAELGGPALRGDRIKTEVDDVQSDVKQEQDVKGLFEPVPPLSQLPTSMAAEPTLEATLDPALTGQSPVDMEIKEEPNEMIQPHPPILQPHAMIPNVSDPVWFIKFLTANYTLIIVFYLLPPYIISSYHHFNT